MNITEGIQPPPVYATYNSLSPKLLTFVPFLGLISSWIAINALDQEKDKLKASRGEADQKRLIMILDLKNHYKLASAARGLLEVALIIVAIAACAITGVLAPLGASALIAIGAIAGFCILKRLLNIYITRSTMEFIESGQKVPSFYLLNC